MFAALGMTDRFVIVGIEFFADRLDGRDARFLQGAHQLLQRTVHAADKGIIIPGLLGGFEGALEVVQHGQQVFDEFAGGVFQVGLILLVFAARNVLELRVGVQQAFFRFFQAQAQVFHFGLQSRDSLLGSADACGPLALWLAVVGSVPLWSAVWSVSCRCNIVRRG